MAKIFLIKISDLITEIEYSDERIVKICRDYIVNSGKADIKAVFETSDDFSLNLSELYRQIAEQLPSFSRAVFHGAVVSYKQNAYMFIAKSGTGKTTHINLWRKYINGVGIINGDKPIISANGKSIVAYGTPWAGKENLQSNTCAPIKGICVIKRTKTNSIRKLNKTEALSAIMKQVYIPRNENALNLTMGIIDDIITTVPFYELSCDISREAVKCSFESMTGENM